jgi:hypothetical protein
MVSSMGSDAVTVVAAGSSGSRHESPEATGADPDGTGALFSPFASIGMAPAPAGEVHAVAAPGDWVTPLAATLIGFACIGVLLRKLVR